MLLGDNVSPAVVTALLTCATITTTLNRSALTFAHTLGMEIQALVVKYVEGVAATMRAGLGLEDVVESVLSGAKRKFEDEAVEEKRVKVLAELEFARGIQ
jgi:hypothetical protein